MRRAILALAFAASPALAQQADPTVDVADDDAAMNEAIAKAQATFPAFWQEVADEEGFAPETVALKVAVEHPEGREHLWMQPCRADEDAELFICAVANQPAHVSLQPGQPYPFERAAITDWMDREGGSIRGGYTLRALLPRLPEAEAEALRPLLLPLED